MKKIILLPLSILTLFACNDIPENKISDVGPGHYENISVKPATIEINLNNNGFKVREHAVNFSLFNYKCDLSLTNHLNSKLLRAEFNYFIEAEFKNETIFYPFYPLGNIRSRDKMFKSGYVLKKVKMDLSKEETIITPIEINYTPSGFPKRLFEKTPEELILFVKVKTFGVDDEIEETYSFDIKQDWLDAQKIIGLR